MNIRLAELIIWNGKAYIPSNGRYSSGIFASTEPVHVVNVTILDIVPVMKTILAAEPVPLPDPTREVVKAVRDLLPRITGARSWKRLCQKGVSYVVNKTQTNLVLEISRLDEKGRWVFDSSKRTEFSENTDLSVVIQAALDDLDTRPR